MEQKISTPQIQRKYQQRKIINCKIESQLIAQRWQQNCPKIEWSTTSPKRLARIDNQSIERYSKWKLYYILKENNYNVVVRDKRNQLEDKFNQLAEDLEIIHFGTIPQEDIADNVMVHINKPFSNIKDTNSTVTCDDDDSIMYVSTIQDSQSHSKRKKINNKMITIPTLEALQKYPEIHLIKRSTNLFGKFVIGHFNEKYHNELCKKVITPQKEIYVGDFKYYDLLWQQRELWWDHLDFIGPFCLLNSLDSTRTDTIIVDGLIQNINRNQKISINYSPEKNKIQNKK